MGIGLGNDLGLGIAYTLKDMFTQNAVKISHAMDGLEKKTDDLAAKIEKAQQRMYGGMKMMAVGGAIVAAFTPAIYASMEFGRAMGEVSTLVDTNTVNMNELSNSLLNLSTKYGQMPVEQTKALYNVLSAGYTNISEANKILEASNKAAIAGVSDVNTAFEASLAIMKPYGMGVDQINNAYDKLFQTVNLGITKMPELSASMSQVTPIAQAVGISIDELLASISSMTVTTKASTSEVATQMSALASGILEGAGKQDLIKKKYGLEIDMSSVALKNKGMVNFLGDITKQLNTLDAVKRDMALSDIFGRREAILAYMTLTGAGAKAFAEHLDKIKNSAGATEDAFRKMSQTVGFQFDRMKSSAMAMLIKIGQAVEPIVTAILSIFTRLTSAISNVIQRFPKLTSFGAQFVLVLGGILTIGGAVVTFLGAVQLALPLIASGLAAVGITATATFSGIWAALAPLAIPILQLVGVFLLIKMAWDRDLLGIRTSLSKAFEPISLLFSAISTAWQSLSGNMIQVNSELAGKLEKAGLMHTFKNIMMFLYRAKQFIVGVFAGLYMAFEPIFKLIGGGIKLLFKLFSPLINIIIKVINFLTGGALTGSGDTFYKIGKAVGFVLSFLIPVGSLFKVIGFGVKILLSPLALLFRGFKALVPVGGLLARVFGWVFGLIKSHVMEQIGIFKFLGKIFIKPFEFIAPYVSRIFGGVGRIAGRFLSIYVNYMKWAFRVSGKVLSWFIDYYKWIFNLGGRIISGYFNFVSKTFSFLGKILISPFKALRDMVIWVFEILKAMPFADFFYIISKSISGILPSLKTIGLGFINFVINPLKTISGLWDSIMGFFTGSKTPVMSMQTATQQLLTSPQMPAFAYAVGRENPMGYIAQDRQIPPTLPTSVQIEKSQILRENTYREKTNTIKGSTVNNNQSPTQVIKLEVDGRTLAQVVNESNKREAVRRL